MDFFAAVSSSFISIIFFCMVIAGVLKLFQVATLLGEIKDVLLKQHLLSSVSTPSPAYERTSQPSATPWTAAPQASSWQPSSSTPDEPFPQVIREPAYVAQPLYPQEAVPASLDEKMSGEAMLRALDMEMRAEEARLGPSVIDTTIVAPHE
ncbi:MAG: hypothetical protein ABI824_13530 [Acidobacteriota bacterium]